MSQLLLVFLVNLEASSTRWQWIWKSMQWVMLNWRTKISYHFSILINLRKNTLQTLSLLVLCYRPYWQQISHICILVSLFIASALVLVMKCSNKANPEDQLPLSAQKTLRKVPWSFLSRKMIKDCQWQKSTLSNEA